MKEEREQILKFVEYLGEIQLLNQSLKEARLKLKGSVQEKQEKIETCKEDMISFVID